MPTQTAFFAYPSSIAEVCDAIANAAEAIGPRGDYNLRTWVENDISGRPLTDPIFEQIEESDFLIADITALNFNVTFEVGYAIGLGKRVHLVRNGNFLRDADLAAKIGIFDTLGFETYTDQNTLLSVILKLSGQRPIPLRSNRNHTTPIYLLQTPSSNQAMLTIIGRLTKTRLAFTSFIPAEEIRLSAGRAIESVAGSLGVVVPLLASTFSDVEVHNIRAAFIAGLAYAMDKAVLILQPADGPAPLDVRDLVKSYRRPEEIGDYISEFALDITERMQEDVQLDLPIENFLAGLSIGDPVAENELGNLGNYYLRTDQFGRASRGEINLVVGRKGSGKTALFSQLRDEKRRDKANVIVDLKPEGYQLIRLKEDVLDFLSEGARNHLITAFFEYVFHLEICFKILEIDKERHVRDRRLYEPYRQLQELYESGEADQGDFSERLLSLSQRLILDFQKKFGGKKNLRLSTSEVTELVYKHNIREIRGALSSYLAFKGGVWVLFDNLDKGWRTQGVQGSDILILRCLIDAARKMQRNMQSSGKGLDFHCVVFVRNDIYQLLVQASADYGKESRAVLDWSDPDLLREVLRRRLIRNQTDKKTTFQNIWLRVCVPFFDGEESSQYLIDRSLMRPRNLLKMVGHCLGFAVNLGHEIIEADDITKGLRAYSLDLIEEAEQELRDVLRTDESLIHHFVGEGSVFGGETLRRILLGADVPDDRVEAVIETLMYYGFIGLKYDTGTIKYIFDVGYDFSSLKVLAKKKEESLLYVLHPAFYLGLNS